MKPNADRSRVSGLFRKSFKRPVSVSKSPDTFPRTRFPVSLRTTSVVLGSLFPRTSSTVPRYTCSRFVKLLSARLTANSWQLFERNAEKPSVEFIKAVRESNEKFHSKAPSPCLAVFLAPFSYPRSFIRRFYFPNRADEVVIRPVSDYAPNAL